MISFQKNVKKFYNIRVKRSSNLEQAKMIHFQP